MFENDREPGQYTANGPAVFVRLTAHLQERIASLVRVVRDQRLEHVVMPLMAADHAWSARYLYAPAAHVFLDSTLCVSATEVWVESARRAWRDEDPPERVATGRLKLRDIMPIDYMPVREIELPPGVSRATVKPYRERLQGLLEADRVYEMISRATYAIERRVPDDELLLADRIWFGRERPFRSAREALARLEDELADWETELEAERCALAQSILGIEMGDIVAAENRGRFLRLSVTGVTLYASDNGATFIVSGTRFRKDGTLGKLQDTLSLHFKADR